MKQRKIPLRMCINCREMKPKREMQRIVKTADGIVNIDMTGKMPGRGAYVCKDAECVKSAKKQKRIEKAFGLRGGDSLYEALLIIAEEAVCNNAAEGFDNNNSTGGAECKNATGEPGGSISTGGARVK